MTDWSVWPIFVAQLIAFILVLIKANVTVLGLSLKNIAFIIVFFVAVAILLSLFHDSMTHLNLYF